MQHGCIVCVTVAARLLPVATVGCHCQLPAQSIKCQKCIAEPVARGGETELNDVLTGGASRLVVRFLGMTDIWLVLTWTQFLTFILLGHRQRFLHNANGRATYIPTSCVNVSVSQSVSQCLHKSVSDLCSRSPSD